MTYEQAKAACADHCGIYRTATKQCYWKMADVDLDDRVSSGDKAETDWAVYDPRSDDNTDDVLLTFETEE